MYYPERLPVHEKYSWSFEEAPPMGKRWVKAYSQQIEGLLALHIHDFYELNIVLGGSGRHYIGERNVPVQKGDVFVIPPSITHGYFSTGRLEILHVLLSNGFMHFYSEPLQRLAGYKMLFDTEPALRRCVETEFYLSLDDNELKKIGTCTAELLADAEENGTDAEIRQSFAALTLIGKLCRQMSEGAMSRAAELLGQKAITVIKSLDIIEKSCDTPVSVKRLAAECGMSYGTYLSDFKRLTGTTPSRYRSECRMRRAEELLRFSDDTVLSIALSLGYYDSAHFIREFKSHSGVSPSRFREG